MRFELFVAKRYLLAKRRQTFISIISVISVLGVALGVMSLIVAMGIINGFTTDLREKILGIDSHVIVSSLFGGMEDYREVADEVKTVPGVISVTPFVYTELMLSAPGGAKGLMLRGIDPATAGDVLQIFKKMEPGVLAKLPAGSVPDQPPLPGIIIGKELAKLLRLEVGQRVNLMSPTGQRSTAGFQPRIRPFRIAGIFSTGMVQYDTSLGFCTMPDALDMVGLNKDIASGLEVLTTDAFSAPRVSEAIEAKVQGRDVRVRPWTDFNPELFSALELEKIVMGVVLALIVLVGSFSIVTTLVMLVMEKTRDIAIMMSMGATGRVIRRIFICQGLIIGVFGTAIGFVLGLGLCFLLQRYKFIKLPEGVYAVDYVPVLLQWQDLAGIAAGAVFICFLATLYPARQASRLVPAEALRYE